MSRKYLQTKATSLSYSISDAETNIRLDFLEKLNGDSISASDIGDIMYFTIDPGTSKEEICSTTSSDVTVNADGTVDMVIVRGLQEIDPYTTGGFASDHGTGAVVVFSNNPQLYAQFGNKFNANTWSDVNTFSVSPIVPTPTTATQAVNKDYVDNGILSGGADMSTTVKGVGRTATSPYKTVGTFTVTIASPAVFTCNSHALTVNDTVQFTTSGALPTGISVSTTYYVISTGLTANDFQIAATLGGVAINTSGGQSGTHTLIRTTPYVINDQDTKLPTQAENDAMAGTSTPSTSNPYVNVQQIRGIISPYAGSAAPTGWLVCDGSAVSRATYADLFAITSTTYGAGDGSTTFNLPDLRSRTVIGVGTGTKVATFASRASNVITVTGLTNASNNEFQTGQAVLYDTTSGVITGLTDNTTYYLIRITNTSFSLATSVANALAGTVIALSSDGSGVQTFTLTLTARTLADTGGEENHALVTAELPAHTHTYNNPFGAAGGLSGGATLQTSGTTATTSTGGNTGHNVMQPFVALTYIIKF